MNNSMVAHLWANEKQESAHGSNFYFEGESIYSYGRHFEVGRIVRNKRGEKAYLINDTYYSSTTSKHQYYVREWRENGVIIGITFQFNVRSKGLCVSNTRSCRIQEKIKYVLD